MRHDDPAVPAPDRPVPVSGRSVPVSGRSVLASEPGRSTDPDRLDVYRLAVQFQVLASGFLSVPRLGALRDQLDRASVSIALNVAEGAGRVSWPDKARFYAIARGSSTECAAILDLMRARRMLSPEDHAPYPRRTGKDRHPPAFRLVAREYNRSCPSRAVARSRP